MKRMTPKSMVTTSDISNAQQWNGSLNWRYTDDTCRAWAVRRVPEFKQKIHDLKMADALLSRMADEYHTVNKAVHRGEAGLDPVDDARLAGKLKERVHLKDKIFAHLTQSN